MTEQEFRELTAYPPPAPQKQNPPVSSIAAAVANKGAGSDVPSVPTPPVPQIPTPGIPTPPQAQKAAKADAPPPIPAVPPIPPVAESLPQNQLFSQIHQQPGQAPVNNRSPLPPAQAHAPTPVSAPAPLPTPAPKPESQKIVPVEKHHELIEQFTRLSDRHKRILAERDELAKQVTELKRALTEREEGGGRDYKEEIRLLGKLIDSEQSLRKAVVDSGAFKPGEDPYARHDKLVQVFLNIVARIE